MKYLFLSFFFFITTSFHQAFEEPINVGGKLELQDFFKREVVYPASALKYGKKGKVILAFTVLKNGKVSNLKVKQGVSKDINAEAIRIFKMINWIPARELDKTMDFNHKVVFNFTPNSYKKFVRARKYEHPGHFPANSDTSMKIYKIVDKPALMGGNRFALNKFIMQNIQYPEVAYNRNISGKVIVRCVIEPHGRPSNIEIIQSVGAGCDEEAARLVALMKWEAAMKNQQYVRSFVQIPISFTFQK